MWRACASPSAVFAQRQRPSLLFGRAVRRSSDMPRLATLLLTLAIAICSASVAVSASPYFPSPAICASYKNMTQPQGPNPNIVSNITVDVAKLFDAFMELAVTAPVLPSILGQPAELFAQSRQEALKFPAVLSTYLNYAQSILDFNATFNAYYLTVTKIAASYAKDNSTSNYDKLNAAWITATGAYNDSLRAINASSWALIQQGWAAFYIDSALSCVPSFAAACPSGYNMSLQYELATLNATKVALSQCGSNRTCQAFYTAQLNHTEAQIALAQAQIAICPNYTNEIQAWSDVATVVFQGYGEAYENQVAMVGDGVADAAFLATVSPFTDAFILPIEYKAQQLTLADGFYWMLQLLTTACTNLYS